MMRRYTILALCGLALAGCDRLRPGGSDWTDSQIPVVTPQPRPDAAAEGSAPLLTPVGARTAAAFDRTTPAERAAAVAPSAGGPELGRVVVALGNPAEPGFWLRSNLVGAARPGVVRLASGATAQVELRPTADGGAQLSLAAYRALGLGLTDLPAITVLGR